MLELGITHSYSNTVGFGLYKYADHPSLSQPRPVLVKQAWNCAIYLSPAIIFGIGRVDGRLSLDDALPGFGDFTYPSGHVDMVF